MSRSKIKWAIIAAVVAILGVAVYMLTHHPTPSSSTIVAESERTSPPVGSAIPPDAKKSIGAEFLVVQFDDDATTPSPMIAYSKDMMVPSSPPQTENTPTGKSPSFGGLTKLLTRGPGANKISGRVVVECAAAEFDPSQVDRVTLIVVPDTVRSWFGKSQPADQQRFTSRLEPDGRFAIYGNLKGTATLTVDYNKRLGPARAFRVPIFNKQFEMNTKKQDQDLGDITVSCGGGLIINVSYPEGVKPPKWGMALAMFDREGQALIHSEPIAAAPGREYVPNLPLGKFKTRIYADTLRFEPDMADVEISNGGQTPMLELTATPTSCIRGVAVLTSESDSDFFESLAPDRVVLTGPDGLRRELTPTVHDIYNLMGRDALTGESFVFFDLPEGEYQVSVEVDGYNPASLEIQLQAGQMQYRGFSFNKKD